MNCPGDADWTDLGRQELTAAPYAVYALGAPWTGISDRPPGLDDGDNDTTYTAGEGLALVGNQFGARGTPYRNVIIVAMSSGDYESVQQAVESIKDASEESPYLVWVAPGQYKESVEMKPHVHIQGAGPSVATILSDAGNPGTYPTEATVVLTHHVSLRDLSIWNDGKYEQSSALLAMDGTTQTVVANVTAIARGTGQYNAAIYVRGAGTDIRLIHVRALAENSGLNSYGLCNDDGASATVFAGEYVARDAGDRAIGISNQGSGSILRVTSASALAEGAPQLDFALVNTDAASATVQGGVFIARGIHPVGIVNGAILDAEGVTAIAESTVSGTLAYGFESQGTAGLRGGSFTARGGIRSEGIYNIGRLVAEGVTALAEGGADASYGLCLTQSGRTVLRGGSFIGRGGEEAVGIYNISAELEAANVTATGEDGVDSWGMHSEQPSALSTFTLSQLEGADASVNILTGSVSLTNSRLVGGAASSSAVCLMVTRGLSVSTDVSPYPCP